MNPDNIIRLKKLSDNEDLENPEYLMLLANFGIENNELVRSEILKLYDSSNDILLKEYDSLSLQIVNLCENLKRNIANFSNSKNRKYSKMARANINQLSNLKRDFNLISLNVER